MSRFTVAATLSVLALPGPALADWQGLPFGITVPELQALVPSARENGDRGKDTGQQHTTLRAWLTAGYQVDGIPVDAFFQFDLEGRYRQVQLEPRDDMYCGALVALIRQYGRPTDITEIGNILRIEQYQDRSGGNLIHLNVPVGSDTSCSVNFRALGG